MTVLAEIRKHTMCEEWKVPHKWESWRSNAHKRAKVARHLVDLDPTVYQLVDGFIFLVLQIEISSPLSDRDMNMQQWTLWTQFNRNYITFLLYFLERTDCTQQNEREKNVFIQIGIALFRVKNLSFHKMLNTNWKYLPKVMLYY